ncbi:hypothetical protein MC885_010813 [Smutsia gigantea]|nr:hypothetical protein MC885_010813 [Smutsia gigantea]
MLAFEFIHFCKDSLPRGLQGRHGYDPGPGPPRLGLEYRFLAWNNPPLTSEFVVLLPALADTGTAVEMLHALLDMPGLTAAMDLQLRSSPAASEKPLWDSSLSAPSCLEALQDPQCQPIF